EALESEAVDNDEDEDRGGKAGQSSGDDGIGWRDGLGILEMQRQQHDEHGEDAGEQGVQDEQPGPESAAARAQAVEVVGGQNGERRNGRQDVAGKLGFREREKDNGNERPEDEELRESVARAEEA